MKIDSSKFYKLIKTEDGNNFSEFGKKYFGCSSQEGYEHIFRPDDKNIRDCLIVRFEICKDELEIKIELKSSAKARNIKSIQLLYKKYEIWLNDILVELQKLEII